MADRELAIKDEKSGATYQEHAREEESVDAVSYRKKEAALVRKLDWFIAPVLMLTQLISYLDRGNIGFAATQGMIEEIHLRGSDLNVSMVEPFMFTVKNHESLKSSCSATALACSARWRFISQMN